MNDRIKRIIGFIICAILILSIVLFIQYKLNEEKSLFEEIKFEDIEDTIASNNECYIWVYSTNCASCKKLSKDLLEIKKDNNIFKDKNVFGINIDKYSGNVDDVLKKYQMDGVPFIVHYSNGDVQDILSEDIKKNEIIDFFSNNESKGALQVQYFFSPTCSSCADISSYLKKVSGGKSNIKINKYNVTSIQNKKLLDSYCEHYKVDSEVVGTVPIIFVRNRFLYNNEIKSELESVIEDRSAGDTVIIANGKNNFSSEKKILENMDIINLIGTAFLNGLNPCSFSMLFFLIVLIESEEKKVLKYGICFCIGKAITLMLLGTIIFGAISVIQSSIIIKIINVALIGILLVLAGLNFNDYIALKQDKLEKLRAQLPNSIRLANNKIITNTINKFKESKLIILICVALGGTIAFTEFLCAGQLYLFSIITIIHVESTLTIKAIIYLMIYSLICVVPLIIAVIIIAFGKKVICLSVVFSEKTYLIKLCYGMTFMAMAVVMILQQYIW